MRNLLLVALALLLFAPSARAAEPASLEELEQRLVRATNKLKALVEEAARDPRERKLEEYLRYSTKQMKEKKRVRAEDIVQWMADPKADFHLRQACKEALKKGAQLLDDPDLSSNIKKRPGTNRGYFFAKFVVPLIAEKDDRNTRTLAHALLKDIYGRVPSVPDIFNYNADAGTSNWKKAVDAYKRHLRKK